MSLTLVAVLPEFQKRGVGKKLIDKGIAEAKRLGFSSVLVLGDPDYYGRFGFMHSLAVNIDSKYSCKEFAALELILNVLSEISAASFRYPEAFASVD